jgi:predicted 3-demethylubiquinone-9 3-methyltransferase (glyoxalase superfamily)
MPSKKTRVSPKITPFLWFNDNAEAAANFYISIFENSKITGIARYTEGSPGQPGAVMTVGFRLLGQDFTALNGGPIFKFTEAVSFVVHCETQKEIDYYWSKLSAGGEAVQCGWLKDKFGLSWQIVPNALIKLMDGKDPARSTRVMKAMLKMIKLDIAGLERAYRGERE